MNGFYPEGEFVGALDSYPVMNNLKNLIPNSSLCVDTEDRFIGDELSIANLHAQVGAFNTALNATIAGIVGSTGGTGALGLLAYNQVQTKNDVINRTAPLLYSTETDTASFDSTYKQCKSYSLPLNYDNNKNLSIDNIEVVSTIATIIKNGSTVNPTAVSGNTYQYIYDQSGIITFNVDTPITRIDTQANSASTTTT